MYEQITYENILERMLTKIPDDMDKREGSIIYDALSPAAIEMQLMYIELDTILRETFADTASREFLIKRCYERGIYPDPATSAILLAEFNLKIELGARFSYELLNYEVIEHVKDFKYKIKCEMPGMQGNVYKGMLIPITPINGLNKAEIIEVLIPGANEEDTEHLRKKYLTSLETQPFGGNVRDYEIFVNELDGVGGAKVYPAWDGGGTVKIVFIDSSYAKPSSTLVNEVQNKIDPNQDGKGIGIAPIGHTVTIVPVTETLVDISTNVTFVDGYSWEDGREIIEQLVEEYFLELNSKWESGENIAVRISQIESRILDLHIVVDISSTKLNEVEQNIILGDDSIAKRGTVSGQTIKKLLT